MAKGSAELVSARREEIIGVCENLYRTTSMKDISLKRVGDETSMTRTAIYNYFKTKEDIFIVILRREFETWVSQLEEAVCDREVMTADEISAVLAETLGNRELLLRLINVEWAELTVNGTPEYLDELRLTFADAVKAVETVAEKSEQPLTEEERNSFTASFFPFLFGIYPCAFCNEDHREKLDNAGIGHIFKPVYDLVYNCVNSLLRKGTAPVIREQHTEPVPVPEPEQEPEQEQTPEQTPEVTDEPEPEPQKPAKPLKEYRWERKSKKRGLRGRV